MNKILIFCLLSLTIPDGFSQSTHQPDTPVILQNDIYNNFKQNSPANNYLGTFAFDSAGRPVSNGQAYLQLAETADSLFTAKAFSTAAQIYRALSRVTNARFAATHRYRWAVCMASVDDHAGAFDQLHAAAVIDHYDNIVEIEKEPAFQVLQKDSRWPVLMSLIRDNKVRQPYSTDPEIPVMR